MAEISDYLNGLNEQVVQEEKEIVVVSNPAVEEICRIYEDWLSGFNDKRPDCSTDNLYDSVIKSLKGKVITAKDILNFSMALKKYERRDWFRTSGIFLSALIEQSKDGELEVYTNHLSQKISWIGSRNEKNIVVVGNVGSATGLKMQKGKLTIIGDVRAIGHLVYGGEIHVDGRFEDRLLQDCEAKIYHKGVQVWPK